MACFIVPLTQAIATSAYRKKVESQTSKVERQDSFISRNLPSLEKMLWGGSLMLIVDHIINGELTWMFPFFTALETEGGGAVMLREMLTVGLPISLVVTLVWAAWCFIKERRAAHA
ncbi:MAG: hypothetical protein IJ776_07950 [Paludibacteraceae bacterium]|nr:hypothetical protein [Paludibacteraceae bacterium]